MTTLNNVLRQSPIIGVVAVIFATICHRESAGQDFSYYDNFDDGDISRNSDGFTLQQCDWWQASPFSADADSGDLVLTSGTSNGAEPPAGWVAYCPSHFDGKEISQRSEWSVRMHATVREGELFVGTVKGYQHVGIMDEGETISVGTNAHARDDRSRKEEMPYPFLGEKLFFQMDAFDGTVTGSIWQNGNPLSRLQFSHPYTPSFTPAGFGVIQGETTFHELRISSEPIPISILPGDFDGNEILDSADIDSLVDHFELESRQFDLTDDRSVDLADHRMWIKDFKNTWYGDANLDGEFSSKDFVHIFQSGKFETDQEATWSDGDWNGDELFNSTDFVVAFQDGGYEQGPRVAVAAVPEPAGLMLLATALAGLATLRRRTSRYVDAK